MITSEYVPQVGHLVDHPAGLCQPYLVVWTGGELCEIVSYDLLAGTSWTVNKNRLRFLADRSKEWEALFQLPNQPTP